MAEIDKPKNFNEEGLPVYLTGGMVTSIKDWVNDFPKAEDTVYKVGDEKSGDDSLTKTTK